jgi:hypothetical protein
MEQNKNNLVQFVIAIALPILLVAILLLTKPKQKSWIEQGRIPSSTNSYSAWAALPYKPISPGADLRSELEQIPVVSTNWNHDDNQLGQLSEMAYNLVAGYNTGDYDTFKKFRFPIQNGSWNAQWISSSKTFLQRLFPDRQALLQAGDETVFKEWFRYTLLSRGFDHKGQPLVNATEQPNGFLRLLSTEGSRFYLETRDSVPPPLDLFATGFENQGYSAYRPAFVFRPTPQDLLRSNKSVTCAVMKLMLKSADDRPMPYYSRLYWVSENNKWLPSEFCIPFAQMKTNVIVF